MLSVSVSVTHTHRYLLPIPGLRNVNKGSVNIIWVVIGKGSCIRVLIESNYALNYVVITWLSHVSNTLFLSMPNRLTLFSTRMISLILDYKLHKG